MEKGKNYAAIDIGSNACRLLIKNIYEDEEGIRHSRKVQFLRLPLRLGMDVFKNGKIGKRKSEQVIRMMKAFKQLIRLNEVTAFRACATSAMRDASNGSRLMREIEKETGICMEIISGQEEARLIYDSHIECNTDRNGNYLYADIGGGSTEISLICQGEFIGSSSYNIGTLRLLNRAVEDDVITALQNDLREIRENFPRLDIIGTGGNINKLYAISTDKNPENRSFSVRSLQQLYDELSPLTVEERIEKYSFKPDRADVIVPAAEIFLIIARSIAAQTILVPNVGLVDGIIADLFEEDLKRSTSLK